MSPGVMPSSSAASSRLLAGGRVMISTYRQLYDRWRAVAAVLAVTLAGAMPLSGQAQAPSFRSASFEGRPAFREGRDFGYYVWRDGAVWRVRWTTRGVRRRFSGHVVAEGGRLDHLKRIDLDEERRVVAPGRAPHVYRGPRGHAHVAPGHGPVVASTTTGHAVVEPSGVMVPRS